MPTGGNKQTLAEVLLEMKIKRKVGALAIVQRKKLGPVKKVKRVKKVNSIRNAVPEKNVLPLKEATPMGKAAISVLTSYSISTHSDDVPSQ